MKTLRKSLGDECDAYFEKIEKHAIKVLDQSLLALCFCHYHGHAMINDTPTMGLSEAHYH